VDFKNYDTSNLEGWRKVNQPQEETVTDREVAPVMQEPIIEEVPEDQSDEEQSEESQPVEIKDIRSKNEELVSATLKNLIKVSKELDDEGKHKAASVIHEVVMKYQGRLS